MYVCEGCSKEYSSQKRYLSHIEHCEQDDNRSVSTNATDYNRSTKTTDKGLLEKLISDRERMKAELRQYKDDIRRRGSSYKDELEQSQRYYQEQIRSLTDEKDELADKLSTIRDEIYNEKEKLRAEFNEKLATEKKRITASAKEQPAKMQTIIDKLQKKLDKQAQEFDELHENNQAALQLKEEQCKTMVATMENRFLREKDEFRRVITTCQSEKDAALVTLRREKDHEIQQVIADRNTIIQSLENTIRDLRNQMEIRDKEHKLNMSDLTETNNREMSEKTSTIKHLIDSHKSIVEKMQTKFEGRLDNEALRYSRDMEKLANEHKIHVEELENSHNISIENIKRDTQRQIQEHIDALDLQKQHTQAIECDIAAQIAKAEQNFLEQIDQTKRYYQNELEKQKNSLTKNHLESVRDRDDTIITLERLNHALGSQVGHFRSAMENMKIDTNRIKQQFIHNLNKQQADSDKLLRDRDTTITELKAEVSHLYSRNNQLTEETKAKFDNMMSEYTRMQHENKLLISSKDTLQRSIDDMDQRFTKQLEITKLEVAERLTNMYTQNENMYKEKLQLAEIKLSEYVSSLKQKDIDHNTRLVELRQDLQASAQKDVLLLTSELERYKADLSVSKNELSAIKMEFDTRVSEAIKLNKKTSSLEIEQLQMRLTKYRDDFDKLNIDYHTLKNQSNQHLIETENNYIKNVDILAEQLKKSKEETVRAMGLVEKTKQEFSGQMKMLSSLSNPEREHLNKLEAELSEKSNNLVLLRGNMDEMTGQISELREQLRIMSEEFSQERKSMMKERDDLLLQVKNSMRDSEVESKLKKMRDDCIEAMRKSRVELAQMTRENADLRQKLSELTSSKTTS